MSKSLLGKIDNWIVEFLIIAIVLLALLFGARSYAIDACIPKEYEKCCITKPLNCAYVKFECMKTAERICEENLFK